MLGACPSALPSGLRPVSNDEDGFDEGTRAFTDVAAGPLASCPPGEESCFEAQKLLRIRNTKLDGVGVETM